MALFVSRICLCVKILIFFLFSRYDYDSEEEEEEYEDEENYEIRNLPSFKGGETFQMTSETLPMVEKKTSPPGYLTESELIALMEKNGIGEQLTGACPVRFTQVQVLMLPWLPTSRTSVSETTSGISWPASLSLVPDRLVRVESGRRLVPTQLGTVLVQVG